MGSQRMSLRTWLVALAALPALAQGVFTNVDKVGDAICPRVFRESDRLNVGDYARGSRVAIGNMSTHYQKGRADVSLGARKSVQAFTAFDESGKAVSIGDLKGKVVLVGFWGNSCEPSAKMLMELGGIYPKREKYGFEILAVNFDESRPQDHYLGGRLAVAKFKLDNRPFFEKSSLPLYIPGVGDQGASAFKEMVYSLPMLCVVDAEGNLASTIIGYEPNYVAANLKRALIESHAALPKPADPAQGAGEK